MTLLGDWRLLAFLVRCGWLDKSSPPIPLAGVHGTPPGSKCAWMRTTLLDVDKPTAKGDEVLVRFTRPR